ncbi:MAG: hypothetical protein ACRELF_13830 [Gemmataceae bacterium]
MMPPVGYAKAVSLALISGQPTSFFTVGGSPGAGTPNTGLTGANYVSSSVIPAGILYHQDPPTGDAYLARLVGVANQAGVLYLCDRLWDCGPTINVSSAQTISQPTLPARDATGTTNGSAVQLAIEVVSTTSATAAVISANYTNEVGTASRAGTFIDLPTSVTAKTGYFYRIGLQSGDHGVRSVQSVTFSTPWTSGTIALVAYRVLAAVELVASGVPNAIDALTSGFPQLFNGVCPFFVFHPSTTAASSLAGTYTETQG